MILLDPFEYRCWLVEWYDDEEVLRLYIRSAAYVDGGCQSDQSVREQWLTWRWWLLEE